MRNKQLGTVAIILGALGILVGVEALLAGGLSGMSFDHGSRTSAAVDNAAGGVMLVGAILLAMSAWLLVVGILLVNQRGVTLAKTWAVFGIVVAVGLVIDAVSNRAMVAELAEGGRFYYPGYLSDLGAAHIPALGSLVVFPIALLVLAPKRRPLEAALTD